jgi:hypothetical protein
MAIGQERRRTTRIALQGRLPFLPVGLSPPAGSHFGAAIQAHITGRRCQTALPRGITRRHDREEVRDRSTGAHCRPHYEEQRSPCHVQTEGGAKDSTAARPGKAFPVIRSRRATQAPDAGNRSSSFRRRELPARQGDQPGRWNPGE